GARPGTGSGAARGPIAVGAGRNQQRSPAHQGRDDARGPLQPLLSHLVVLVAAAKPIVRNFGHGNCDRAWKLPVISLSENRFREGDSPRRFSERLSIIMNVTQKLIADHLVEGQMVASNEIG